MWSETDAIRSLQRFVASVLDTVPQIEATVSVPWDVQRARREPTNRPGAVVRALPVQPIAGTAYVVDVTQPFEIFIWPLGVEGDAVGSEDEAQRIRTVVRHAFTQGFGLSRTLRVAAFDYDDVDYNEAPPVADPYGFFRVDRNFSTQVRVDPDQDDLYTIFVNLSLSWTEQGDTRRFDGNLLQPGAIQYVPPDEDEIP